MRLRMTASIQTLLCSWVLWEKWIMLQAGKSDQRTVVAVSESDTLAECQGGMHAHARVRAGYLREAYTGPDYGIMISDSKVVLSDETHATTVQYVYYCLPSTIDPYRDPQ